MRVLRWLSWFHRWTGVVLCLLFLLWFASGAILIFVPYPSLSDQARLSAGEAVDYSIVRTSPAQALAAAGGGDGLRLVSGAGTPLYVIKPAHGSMRAVDAASGRLVGAITAEQARAIALQFTKTPVKQVSAPFQYDQWVVHDRFDPWRPFYRVSLDDRKGTQVYVSARTGEVLQRTLASERAWNWGGSVIHWLYFTALRRSFTAWDQTVWWVSLVGLATALVGVFLGIYRTQKRMKARRPDWSPFHGWLRWHHGLGLGVALFVITWIFSGWLSMDHGRLFSRGWPAAAAEARYRGAPLAKALADVAPSAFTDLGPASQLTFAAVGARPIVAAEGAAPPQVRLLDQPHAPILAMLPSDLLATAASTGWRLASRSASGPERGDKLYRAAEGMADRVVRFPLAAPADASVYLDPVSGSVVVMMTSSRKAYAWVYFALHTFKFPGLLDHPVLRNLLELIPLSAGFLFSLTGLVIAVKRLRIATA